MNGLYHIVHIKYHKLRYIFSRISGSEMSSIIEELYPESPFQRKIMKEHQEAKVARQLLARNLNTLPPVEKRRKKPKYDTESRLPPGGHKVPEPYESAKKHPAVRIFCHKADISNLPC